MNPVRLAGHTGDYLTLYADCFLVQGHTRTMICDVSRKKMFFISNAYHELLLELKTKTIGEVGDMLEDQSDFEEFEQFANYLISHELGFITDNIECFPPIDLVWDSPYSITNAIIDIREKRLNFEKIFLELEQLNCPYVQIRAYSVLSPEQLQSILLCTAATDFKHMQFLLKFPQSFSIEPYSQLVQQYKMISLQFHSVPGADFEQLKGSYPYSDISFIRQEIDSCAGCGVINSESFTLYSLHGFIENIRFNGCLNRKISIDENGDICNCPSMAKKHGNIDNTYLKDVMAKEEFQVYWHINKDEVAVCKDCEYRYICTDCRAYLTDPGNLYSKPLKCNYNPYTAKWNNQ
ncbi:grasp-with-spasm system SPASM domain peptide maturase [Deminuibacter soli]|uniref:Grasp-with-spasm system SPASM domain peptide maturase n=1 Tax=Deminuibacter soli TaxID=2291815 RepID=A0A3E1NFD8_9BACT|nr:grasp-with-spasm system SPASM domain peptide maturase [Deminuibacter soli]RFM26695.1 grasp-with-spasm system SPASM domain peptide maturase [Deminuibacter soli]